MQLCEAIISLSKLVLWKVLPTWFGSSLLQHFRYSNFKTAGPRHALECYGPEMREFFV